MNAFVNINVRVYSRQALAAIGATEAGMASMGKTAAASSAAASAGFGRMVSPLARVGNQLQWTGRMLQYNFTLPILLAGAAATKFALDNEKAMTRVQKVYGDGSLSVKTMKDEIEALGGAFEELSNKFGVAQADVINIGADWAAAGASGIALARSVDLTLQTMILGELDAAKATQQLIAIQAQYGLSIGQLSNAIDVMNMTENQTGISMAGLMDVMSRTSGVARHAGVSIQTLAAYAAALVPAAGTASTAGNGLKTIITRLEQQTAPAAEAFKALGINVDSSSWAALTATDRMQLLAEASDKVTESERNKALAIIFGSYQVNRASILLADITNKNGYYQKALDATSDSAANFAQKQKELNQVLSSNPQRLQQMWVILQNAMADVIQPLLPTIVGLAASIAHLANWFANLDPTIQKVIGLFLLWLALFGPLIRYLGATITLLAELRTWFTILGTKIYQWMLVPLWKVVTTIAGAVMSAFGALIGALARTAIAFFLAGLRALWFATTSLAASIAAATSIRGLFVSMAAAVTMGMRAAGVALLNFIRTGVVAGMTALFAAIGPWGWAIVAAIAVVVAAVIAFRSQIAAAFKWVVDQFTEVGGKFRGVTDAIINAFYSLPAGVQGALMALVNIVRAAVMAVYDWLSYLNPFAEHSPSLVSQVRDGVEEIKRQYATLNTIGPMLAGVASDIQAFKSVVGNLGTGEFEDARKAIAKLRPGAMDEFQTLIADLHSLQAILKVVGAQVDAQEKVVARWQGMLDIANRRLEKEQEELDKVQGKLDRLTDSYNRHEAALQSYADAPIKGMDEMSDKIFANEQAQKRLQLQIMKWEKANGSIEDMQNNLSMLAGDIEKLRGEAEDLRTSGAGSDILGPINDQIAAMDQQYNQVQDTIANAPINELTKQLEDLQAKGQMLDLRNSLKFDDQLRQIDELANGMKELPFNTIINGIKDEQAAMDALQPHIDKATEAVNKQNRAVDEATKVRDRIQARYDAEQAKLDKLNDKYQKIESSISDITSALNDMGTAAQSAIDKSKSAASAAAGAGAGGGGSPLGKPGDFPTAGGQAQIGRVGGPGSQADLINQFTAGIADDVAGMFDQINIMDPLKEKWNAAWGWVTTNVGPALSEVGDAIAEGWKYVTDAMSGNSENTLTDVFDTVKKTFNTVSGWIKDFLELIKPGLEDIWSAITGAFKKVQETLGPMFSQMATLIGPLVEALGHIWSVISKVATVIMAVLIPVIAAIFNVLAAVLGPILNLIIEVFGAIMKISIGFAKFILNLINGDFKEAWDGLVQIIIGVWDAIFAVFRGAWNIVVGIFQGIWDTIYGIGKWIYNVLVGHSIFPDLVKAIVGFFQWMIGPIKAAWNLIVSAIKFAWENVLKPLLAAAWGYIKFWAQVFMWIWDNIIKPAWEAIKTGIKFFWENFLKPLLDKIKVVVKAWATVFKWIWQNVIKPAWELFKEGVKSFWENFLKPLLDKIKTALKVWSEIFKWVWQNLIKPAWDAIKTGIQAVWENVLKPLWDRIKEAFRVVGGIFREVWQNAIQPAWEAIKSGISNVVDRLKEIWENLKTAFQAVKTVFQNVGDAIKGVFQDVWEKIQEVAKWVVDKIEWIGDKLQAAKDKFSWLPGVANGGPVGGAWRGGLAFAAGGKVLGPGTETSDSVLARLSRGEYVVRAAAVRALGLPFLNWVNQQGYASGGLAGTFGRADSAMAGSLTPVVVVNNNTTVTLTGDLSFPNITDPDDASDFIENLKSLAG